MEDQKSTRYSVSLLLNKITHDEVKHALVVQILFANSKEEALGGGMLSQEITDLQKQNYNLSCNVIIDLTL